MRSFFGGCLLFVAYCALAQTNSVPNIPVPTIDFSDRTLFPNPNRSISTPEPIIGAPFASRHMRSHEINEYFQLVARQSDRVLYFSHGRSHEGRPIPYAVVSDPANLNRLQAIQEANRRLFTEPQNVTAQQLAQMPVVVWMGYGVHGDEGSGPEAAVMTLYRLAASNDATTREYLKNTVVILLPDYNPDGRERFTSWVNSRKGVSPNEGSADYARRIPWPGGRTNHYWFDLNRDWLPLTQPETVGRHALWVSWRPQLTLDWHEMGGTSTYFFQPGIPTRTNPHTPAENQKITAEIASFYAKSLEERNEFYFIEERFDDFYVGKGSTYPDVSGSVGILFEQAATRGILLSTPTRTLDFATSVLNQYATSVASLEAAHAKRQQLLDYQRRFYAEPYTGTTQAYDVQIDPAPEKVYQLGHMLQQHGIVTQHVTKPEGKFLRVPLNQPLWRLITAAFDKQTRFEDDQFYDISAWSVDLAVGIPAQEVATLTGTVDQDPDWLALRDKLGSAPGNVKNPIGYVVKGDTDRMFPTVFHAQQQGFHAYVVTRDMRGLAAPGDILLTTEKPDQLSALTHYVNEAATRQRVTIRGIEGQTGQVVSWGGGGTSFIRPLNIALVVGSGSNNDLGEIWHLLDHTWGIKVTLIDSTGITANSLSRFSHIIVGSSIGTSDRTTLTNWVNGGGTLIGTVGGVTSAAAIAGWELETRSYSPSLAGLPYGEISATRTRHGLPGSIFQAEFDLTHPLAFGLPKTLPVFREGTSFIVPPRQAGTVVGTYSANPLLAGYVSPEVLNTAKGAACVLARSSGSGKVILITDNVNFRAFFTGPNRLLGNALFYSTAF